MINKRFEYVEKHDNESLTANEWNNLAQDVEDVVDTINEIENKVSKINNIIEYSNIYLGEQDTKYESEEAGLRVAIQISYWFDRLITNINYDRYMIILPLINGDGNLSGVKFWTTDENNPLKTFILNPSDKDTIININGVSFYVFYFTKKEIQDLKILWKNKEITNAYIGGDNITIPGFKFSSTPRKVYLYGQKYLNNSINIEDIIKFTLWAKKNKQGPWASI